MSLLALELGIMFGDPEAPAPAWRVTTMSKHLWEVIVQKGYDPDAPPSHADLIAAMERAPTMIQEMLQDVIDRHYPETP